MPFVTLSQGGRAHFDSLFLVGILAWLLSHGRLIEVATPAFNSRAETSRFLPQIYVERCAIGHKLLFAEAALTRKNRAL